MTRIIINPFGRSFPIQKRVSVLSQINLFPKQIVNGLSNKRLAKRFCFYKVLIPSSFKGVALERLWENQFVCESFTFQKEK